MLIWMLMGGQGKRFQAAGYTTPKPLLPVGEKCLVQLAMESYLALPGSFHYSLWIETAVHPALVGRLPPGCWHLVVEPTAGPLPTILEGRRCLSGDEELLVGDCDSFLNTEELAQAIAVFRQSAATGGVTVRRTTDPNSSYARITPEWWVEETREKDVFTQWSTTGPYWFRSTTAFLTAAQKAANAHHVSISPVYNYLLGKTLAVPVQSFQHLGTPEEYEAARKTLACLT